MKKLTIEQVLAYKDKGKGKSQQTWKVSLTETNPEYKDFSLEELLSLIFTLIQTTSSLLNDLPCEIRNQVLDGIYDNIVSKTEK